MLICVYYYLKKGEYLVLNKPVSFVLSSKMYF